MTFINFVYLTLNVNFSNMRQLFAVYFDHDFYEIVNYFSNRK